MEEGFRVVCKGVQEVFGKFKSIIWWGGEIVFGLVRLGRYWGLERSEGCLFFVQFVVDEVLGLVGRGAG